MKKGLVREWWDTLESTRLTMTMDFRQFLEITRQPLADGDADTLARAVGARWSAGQLCSLLKSADVDARRVAAMVLGLIGDRAVIPCLVRTLHDEDSQVNGMAEHALWSIWFRSGTPQAAAAFQTGVDKLAAEEYDQAIDCFRQALTIDPDFSEAYNQCALAHFFLGQWQRSIDDCLKALARMPNHFGAMSGVGHNLAHLDRLDEACHWYEKALAINPRMTRIRRAIEKLRSRTDEHAAQVDARLSK